MGQLNRERANSGARAVAHAQAGRYYGKPESNITRVLCNILHYSDRLGIDTENMLERVKAQWLAECESDK